MFGKVVVWAGPRLRGASRLCMAASGSFPGFWFHVSQAFKAANLTALRLQSFTAGLFGGLEAKRFEV